MEITNASQNTEGDRLFMGKEESELHVKIKYKTKYGRLNRLRKQKGKVVVTNVTKSLGKLRASLSCGGFSLNMISSEYTAGPH